MSLGNFNLWLYHSTEVLICDIKLAVYGWQIRRYDNQIERLIAQRTR